MRALLLAGGLGTRLRPLTYSVPKCLVPIHGKPLMEYWLDLLFNAGFESVLVNTHYLAESVRVFVKNSKWSEKIVLVHEDILLGTGGTVLANADWIGRSPILVAHADNLTKFDPLDFWVHHDRRPQGCCMTMMTFKTDSPATCGIVEEEDGVLRAFYEKVEYPPGNKANAAVYIFEPQVIDFLKLQAKHYIDISLDVIPNFLGQIYTYQNNQYHRDIGSIASLIAAEKEY